ncbi:MAG: HAMP domain-containing sensor histidine kinase, partial [Desulfuromonadales bacterium]
RCAKHFATLPKNGLPEDLHFEFDAENKDSIDGMIAALRQCVPQAVTMTPSSCDIVSRVWRKWNQTFFMLHNATNRPVANVMVKLASDQQPFLLDLDANILKQILLNIIMNALQAMENDGGRLLVKTTAAGNDRISFIISDNGPGISPESFERIFDRYFTTKKPGEGTGLGLFVTKNLVDNLGGEIAVMNNSNGGTSFNVTLPVWHASGQQ